MVLPLEGIHVLDSAHQYPGPYCTMLLGDLGADIIKIERPGVGDPARAGGHFFRSLNRNKQSLTLNLKTTEAREILYRLIEQADVFTEGFRPGVVSRLGIDYETLKNLNPRLIYCSISGYGQEGPYRDLPGHDLNYQAMAGMLECFKDKNGHYITPGVAIGDLSSGMFAVIGIMAALMAREKTGKGQYIDLAMSDGLLSWMTTFIGNPVDRLGGETRDAGYGIFQGGDQKSFTIGIAHENWFWDRLCTAVGLDQFKGLGGIERRQRRNELVGRLQDVFDGKSRDEWVNILTQADVPVFPVRSYKEVPNDPHVKHREMIREVDLNSGETIKMVGFPIKLSQMPRDIRKPPPELGEHTEAILKSLGFSIQQIEQFREDGII